MWHRPQILFKLHRRHPELRVCVIKSQPDITSEMSALCSDGYHQTESAELIPHIVPPDSLMVPSPTLHHNALCPHDQCPHRARPHTLSSPTSAGDLRPPQQANQLTLLPDVLPKWTFYEGISRAAKPNSAGRVWRFLSSLQDDVWNIVLGECISFQCCFSVV